ncbi:hypothetical protein QNI19_17630 [Cytophagaceae bacterium DM2B3-1]|uniref:Carboxypeptidase regulatory-like domain-containing protein n=1 Tax=Xanthocytophaga flava TaxID=3048013 RepID=A0ABT7CLY9_9BACT|nr:hypothetical protein [Xanthocytophaga flavus]MDJ1494764.1 hypothetical protein [Xanthocytophaga flavus]
MKHALTLAISWILAFGVSSCFHFSENQIQTIENTLNQNQTPDGLASVEGKITYQFWGWKRADDNSKVYLVSLTTAKNRISNTDIFKTKTFETRADREGSFKLTGLPKDQYMLVMQSDNVENDKFIQEISSSENYSKLEPVLNNVKQLKSLLETQKATVIVTIDFSIPSCKIINQDFGSDN